MGLVPYYTNSPNVCYATYARSPVVMESVACDPSCRYMQPITAVIIVIVIGETNTWNVWC